MINGINWSWKDVTLILLGVPIVGVLDINYDSKQTKANNYGIGVEPVSRGYGTKEYAGSIKLYYDELVPIMLASPNQDIMAIPPFNIQVLYGPTRIAAKMDILHFCEFLENPLKTAQGETKIEITLPIIVGRIEYDV